MKSLAVVLFIFTFTTCLHCRATFYKASIVIPNDRTKLGSIELVGAGGVTLAGPFPVYGKADGITAKEKGNPERLRTKRFGDAPVGVYNIILIERTGPGSKLENVVSYGSNGAFDLIQCLGKPS